MMTVKVSARGPIVLLCVVCFTSAAFAQTKWWKAYGGIGNEEGHSVQPTTDGGYIVAGSTYSFGPGTPDSQNVYLIKSNAQGDTLWTRVYGGAGVDVGQSVQQTTDGGYIVAGYTTSFGAGHDDAYLIKTNAQGDTLWTRTYGGPSYEYGYSVQQTVDGGYAIAGVTGHGMGDFYLIRTDSSGDTLWTRTNGGANTEWCDAMRLTADGGYIITGLTYSFGPGIPDSDNVYLVRTNAQGDTLWTRCFGGRSWDEGYSVAQTADSGFVVAGLTQSFGAGMEDVYLIKTNARGDTLWVRTIGGTANDFGNSVQPCADGGLVIAGVTYSSGPGGGDVYLVKTNALGDTLWTRTYGGGTNPDWGNFVRQCSDGGYIITGGTYSFGAGNEDVYLIKTDSLGLAVAEPLTGHALRPTRFLVQPNPFTSCVRVPGHEADVFVLSDVTGRQVAICKGDRIGQGLRPGVYFLSPVGPRAGKSATATIVKTAF
jgi:hypothetical protein